MDRSTPRGRNPIRRLIAGKANCDGGNVVVIREIRGVFQTASLEHLPNFPGHRRPNGGSDKK
jgi:hypothetical protein